ncbi:iron-containing alcohol dehydrogenase [Pigmentiphaga sp. GD03639]|uniref:iron-containing alcohol dehydrogenase n=1 Tax=Pigmentiphaga sp. GD03639 TaxID=2975354 RepID=UPI0024484B43|nr:iron-containing alcohol dehydrogenase [Pigmentiphaga sp. GD03639]MDH2239388.1 iron-containing alcohol dehydrogenase [Pigmentiphaga sp. GD03639]
MSNASAPAIGDAAVLADLERVVLWPGHCGHGQAAWPFAAQVLRRARRVAVIADPRVWPLASPALQRAADRAGCRIAAVYDGVRPNPSLDEVRAAAAAIRADRCDALVAIGGGSAIDTAKVAYATVFGGQADPADLLAPGNAWMAGAPQADDPLFLAVPTTAGTGSESSTAALVKDEHGRKLMFRSARSRPGAVVLAPELTLGLPRAATAAGGFDALLHAMGALVNDCDAPVGAALAAESLVRALHAYPRVLATPDDADARAAMLMASYLAGVAIGMKRVDAVHGLCTPLEGRVDMAHAEVLAAIFDPIADHTARKAAASYARAARRCGLAGPDEDDAQAAGRLLDAIRRMRALGGLPDRPPPLALTRDDALALADQALLSPSTRLNPRALDRDDIAGLYLDIAARSQAAPSTVILPAP